MPTPSTYPLTMADIQAEFGAHINTSGECTTLPGVSGSYPLSSGDLLGLSNVPAINVTVADESSFDLSDLDQYLTLTAVVTGGDGSHTYAWTKISGDASIFINGSTTGSTCSIRCTTPLVSGEASAIFRCTVDDGITTDFDDANTNFTWGLQ